MQIQTINSDSSLITKTKKAKTEKNTSLLCNKLISKHLAKGYTTASIDSIYTLNDTIRIIFTKGHKFYLNQIKIFGVNKNLISHFPYRNKKNKTYHLNDIKKIQEGIINKVQNSGYPWPSISNQTTIDSNYYISHNLTLQKGQKYSYQSLKIPKTKNSEHTYLSNLTKIKEGFPYKKRDVNNIDKAINNTGIFRTDSIEINYLKNEIKIIPHITKLKTNSASALIGIQTNENKETMITGNAELHTKNLLKRGEQLDFVWIQPAENSQILNIKSKVPYIFSLPLGVIAELNINKQDTSFSYQTVKLGLSIPVTYSFDIDTYYTYKNNTMYKNKNSKQYLYGISLHYSQTDNYFFPQKGITALVDFSIGNRKQDNYPKETIIQNQNDINLYFKFLVGSIKFRNYSGIVFNDSIKQNELFQVGGTNTIRGFNENSIFSKAYNISTFEYRILIANNSYTSIFTDFGIFNNYLKDKDVDYRQSAGAGLTLTTKAGILSVSYALGRLNTEPLNVNNAKIHIGYMVTF